ncbi:hypothetical protein [Microvirga arsenatis]|uniref:Phasin domain-containing protein n=1 Tax=Microvirga arsenatis TaxID=2692265 RepID=A0ABW9Z0N7_9HYPH|nr:hypothetical protein [Microvirga arsenatis]NBJ12543.1 hypothetical protein [Microvirga arsenatis]NBJ26219.1 hypothetical protein [Microvirga arsenatis]
MTETKKTRAKGPGKSTQKADLVEMAAASVAEAAETVTQTKPASQAEAPAKPVEAAALFASARKQSDALRKAMGETVAASAKGALEVNGKIIDALTVQSDVAVDLWRSALNPSPLPEAIKAHSHATRVAYETASAQWKDIAETTALWFTRSLEPLQSAFQTQGR